MNNLLKYLSTCLLGIATLLVGASPAWAQSLGTASGFSILGGPAVTCTTSVIAGDVGVGQSAAFTNTGCTIAGNIHAGDAVAIEAYADFLRAYADLAPQVGDCDVAHTLAATITGPVTLLPGTYCTDAALTGAGVLTLDGNNATNPVWIFKIGTKGTGALTGTNFSVVMTNGGEPCNVTWWVAQAATMTDSNFIGTILAGAAITMTDGRSTLAGRALAKAAVTMTNATVVGCEVLSNAPFCNGKKHHGKHHGHDKDHKKCNQGVGNGAEGCDPGNSDHASAWPFGSNDENDGNKPGNPGRKGGKK